MLTRIKNANMRRSRIVLINRTNITFSIANILKKEGFIESFEEVGDVIFTEDGFFHKNILINLKYSGIKQKPYITNLKRVSKPGLRVYVNKKNIPKVLGGIGVAVFSLCIIYVRIFKLKFKVL